MATVRRSILGTACLGALALALAAPGSAQAGLFGRHRGHGSSGGSYGGSWGSYGSVGGSWGSRGGSWGSRGGSWGSRGGSWGSHGSSGGSWGSYGSVGGSWGSSGGGSWGSVGGSWGSYGSVGGSWGSYGGPFVLSDAVDPGATSGAGATEMASDLRPGYLMVNVPAEARVYLQGQLMTPTGTRRRFVTQPIDEGFQLRYNVRVELERDGRTISKTSQAVVRPGQEVELTVALDERRTDRLVANVARASSR